jgi:hypothetical protein
MRPRRRELQPDPDQQREQHHDEEQQLVPPPEEDESQLVKEKSQVSPNVRG